MSSAQQLLDVAGRRRSPATLSEFHAGRAPGNKGQRYAADPPTVDEIIAVMRHAGRARYGNRLNGLIVVLWRAGLRINEALSLNETDLEERRGSILVRHGKNDRRRQVGMDAWGWSALGPWLSERATLPVGPLFCVIAGPTRGHAWSAGAAQAANCTTSRLRRASAGASRPTSCAMRTLSSCCMRASRCR
jgi:integrase